MNEKEILGAVISCFAKAYGLQVTQPYKDGYTVFRDDSGKEIDSINFDGYNLLYNLTKLCELLNAELL